jgi:hypothetical protein
VGEHNLFAQTPSVQGEGQTTAPVDRVEQVKKLQEELRHVRARKAALQERQSVLETSLTALHSELAVLAKLSKLSPQEKEALLRLSGG